MKVWVMSRNQAPLSAVERSGFIDGLYKQNQNPGGIRRHKGGF